MDGNKAEFDAYLESVEKKFLTSFYKKKLLACKCRNYVPFHLSVAYGTRVPVLCTKVLSPLTFSV
jgi:hypothetical protein